MPILSNMRTIINQSLPIQIKATHVMLIVIFFRCDSKDLKWILHWCWRHFCLTFKNLNEVEITFSLQSIVEQNFSLWKNQNPFWQTVSHCRARTYAFVCKSLVYITFELSIAKHRHLDIKRWIPSNHGWESTNRQNDWHHVKLKWFSSSNSIANNKETKLSWGLWISAIGEISKRLDDKLNISIANSTTQKCPSVYCISFLQKVLCSTAVFIAVIPIILTIDKIFICAICYRMQ